MRIEASNYSFTAMYENVHIGTIGKLYVLTSVYQNMWVTSLLREDTLWTSYYYGEN